MSSADLWGSACHRQATSPQTIGVENDVPMSLVTVPRLEISVAGLPIAMISGFTRPSCVGPTALKGALFISCVSAPTLITS